MTLRRLRGCLLAAILISLCAVAQAQVAGQTRMRDVVYGHKLGMALVMDVFKPAKPNGVGVLWMVSGGWHSDYSAISPEIAAIFTSRGQTVFEVCHGSQPRFTVPEIVQDIYRAVRFVRTHAAEYGVDRNRLGVAGASSGGHLTMMVAAYGGPGDPSAKDPVDRASSAVQAVACFFPPTDFLDWGKPGVNMVGVAEMKPYWHVFGLPDSAPVAERDKVERAMSPIYGLSKQTPPTLIIHGDADTLVPIQQSEIVMAKLQKLGVPHKLIVKHGGGHGWAGIMTDAEQLAGWFDKYLAPHAQ